MSSYLMSLFPLLPSNSSVCKGVRVHFLKPKQNHLTFCSNGLPLRITKKKKKKKNLKCSKKPYTMSLLLSSLTASACILFSLIPSHNGFEHGKAFALAVCSRDCYLTANIYCLFFLSNRTPISYGHMMS